MLRSSHSSKSRAVFHDPREFTIQADTRYHDNIRGHSRVSVYTLEYHPDIISIAVFLRNITATDNLQRTRSSKYSSARAEIILENPKIYDDYVNASGTLYIVFRRGNLSRISSIALLSMAAHLGACAHAETPILAAGRFDFACRQCEAMPRTVASFNRISGSTRRIAFSSATEACATDHALNKRAIDGDFVNDRALAWWVEQLARSRDRDVDRYCSMECILPDSAMNAFDSTGRYLSLYSPIRTRFLSGRKLERKAYLML